MGRLQRDVLLIRLIELLHQNESWCGETHIQKATYLLQEMVAVPTGFDFILYKHGPFSFDLRDEIAAMRADGLVELKVRGPEYGPSIVPGPGAAALCERFPRTLKEQDVRLQFVARNVGNKTVVELERLATAFYVSKELGVGKDPNDQARRVNELKQHIPVEQALLDVQKVASWKDEVQKLLTAS
jgi:hypothetical protein